MSIRHVSPIIERLAFCISFRGAMVQRLARGPFKAEIRVRFPLALPTFRNLQSGSRRLPVPKASPRFWRRLNAEYAKHGRNKLVMKEANKRWIFRWIHILFSIPILGYIYNPFEKLPDYALATRFVFLPVMVLSGLWMWKGHLVRRLLSKRPVDLFAAATLVINEHRLCYRHRPCPYGDDISE